MILAPASGLGSVYQVCRSTARYQDNSVKLLIQRKLFEHHAYILVKKVSLKHQATNHRVPKLTKDDRLDDGVESHHFALVGAVGHRTLHHRANADLVREVEMREVIGQAGNTATAATLRGRRRVSVVGAAADVLAAAVQRGRPTGR